MFECEEGTDDSPIRGQCLEGVDGRGVGEGLESSVAGECKGEPGAAGRVSVGGGMKLVCATYPSQCEANEIMDEKE